jgi:hypothetical protein
MSSPRTNVLTCFTTGELEAKDLTGDAVDLVSPTNQHNHPNTPYLQQLSHFLPIWSIICTLHNNVNIKLFFYIFYVTLDKLQKFVSSLQLT